jgi:hypothetical protein
LEFVAANPHPTQNGPNPCCCLKQDEIRTAHLLIAEEAEMARDDLLEKEATQGEKMIEIKVRFWTNDIAEGEGLIRPKHAWTSGVVRMERNKTHGIIPENPVPFQSLLDLPAVLEKVLQQHGIRLHASRRMSKYIVGD